MAMRWGFTRTTTRSIAGGPCPQWGRRIRRRLRDGTGVARHIDQLTSCREVDYRIRGYRPPQSRITRELGDANLCWHNFEWFASSTHSLHLEKPALVTAWCAFRSSRTTIHSTRGRHRGPTGRRVCCSEASRRDFTALSLHDCYADLWLPHYAAFLERLQRIGRLVTLDEVAARQFLTTAA